MVIYSYVSLPEGIQNADAISQSDRPNPPLSKNRVKTLNMS